MSKNIKHKGSVLVFALIVLSFILISAFTVASVTLIERRSANVSVNSTTAFQNSDKGMEDFLQQLYKDMQQTDTLDNLAVRLNDVYGGEQYVCSPGTEDGKVAAYIGNVNTEFIISAYKEGKISESDTRSGWRSVLPITDCSEQLANVSRFKVAGNYNSAVRAVFVKLRNSLTRGLLAHWSFEDRAQIERFAIDGNASSVAYIAQDFSKNDHTLTLCKIAADSADLPITVELPETDYDLTIDSFAECGNDEATGMDPKKNGAWVGGIVEELGTFGGALGNNDAKEALFFDGIDDYLAMNVDSNCHDDMTNCVNTSLNEDKLQPEDGISISLWVKPDNNASGTIISRHNGDKGYRIYLENGNVCFQLNNNTEVCSSSAINDNDWHHVVGRWQKAKAGGNAFFSLNVDDDLKIESTSTVREISYGENKPLYVGASDETMGFFKGRIDDVRIWDRELTDEEVDRLCLDAQGTAQEFDCLLTKK